MNLGLTLTDQRNASNVIQETIGCETNWPLYIRKLFHSSHLQQKGRFELTEFLLYNGVHGDWIMAHYSNQKCLYDDAARKDVAAMWKRYYETGRIANLVASDDMHFYFDTTVQRFCTTDPFDYARFVNWLCFQLQLKPAEQKKQPSHPVIEKLLSRQPQRISADEVVNFVQWSSRELDIRSVSRRTATASKERYLSVLHDIFDYGNRKNVIISLRALDAFYVACDEPLRAYHRLIF